MNKIKLLLMLLLVSVFTAQAQVTPSTLTLYDGTIENACVPICGAMADSYQRIQYVMPSEDLTALVGKTLNGMTFHYVSDDPTPVMDGVEVEVYMKPYANDFLGYSFINMDDATMVYEGELILDEGEMAIEFTEVYDYWEGNILVELRVVVPGENPALTFKGVDKRDASIYSSNVYGIDYITNGAKQNFLPKTTISYEQSTFYEITATANPDGAATFIGVGQYREGVQCTLTAVANFGYGFDTWTLNGDVVSTDPSYTFEVEGDAEYVANFTEYVIIDNSITIYDDPSEQNIYYSPMIVYYFDAYTRAQHIIPAEQIESLNGSSISAITYYFNPDKYRDGYQYPWTSNVPVDVYLKEVNYTAISSYISKTNDIIYYTGYLTYNADGEVTITLDREYQYTGGNLLIGVDNLSKGTYNQVSFYGQTVYNASISGYNYDNPSGASINQRNFLPKTTFTSVKVGRPAEITAVVEPEGTGTVTGAGAHIVGEQATLTATAEHGYVFDKWTNEEEELVSNNASFTFDIIGDTTLIANFVLDTFDIAVYADPSFVGTVEGAGRFAYGTQHTITATVDPLSEYHFVNWTNFYNEIVSTDATYEFTVEDYAEFFAHFSLNDYEVTAVTAPEGKGTITGEGPYAYAQWATLTVEPDIDYRLVNWTSGETVISTDATIYVMVLSDTALVANLEKYLTLVTIDSNGDDNAVVTGAGAYEAGTEVTVTATPTSEMYYFINWTSGNDVVSTDPEYTFEIGDDDVELVANFGCHMTNGVEVLVHDNYYNNNEFVPFYGWYADVEQQDQMIYPAEELEALVGKDIKEFTFYCFTGDGYNVGEWIISLGETEATELYELDTETELTEVYSGTLDDLYNANLGSMRIVFDEPYTYNGGNLLVQFVNTNPDQQTYKNYYFYGDYVYYYATYTYNEPRNFLPRTCFRSYDAIEPAITVEPNRIEFAGLRPNNAWMDGDDNYYVTVLNCLEETEITGITMTNDYFSYALEDGVELPLTLEAGEIFNIQVFRGDGVGVQTGDMVIAYGENLVNHVALKATAYEPEDGDVWENAIVVEFDDNNEYENKINVDNLKWNYYLDYNDETMVDAVYKVTLEKEAYMEAGSIATNSVTRFYTSDFQEVGGPSAYNSYWYYGPKYVENRGNRDTDYINEKFDGDEMPEDWTIYAEGANTWTLNTESHYVKCSHNVSAGQAWQGRTYLVTPVMDLSNETNVLVNLKFMNKQWDNDVDYLEVAYRNYGGEWITLKTVLEANETWTDLELKLTSDYVSFTDGFQLAFVMNDHYGYGVLIDEVLVKGYPQPQYTMSTYCSPGTYYVVVSTDDEELQQVNIRLLNPSYPQMASIYYPYYQEGVTLDASIQLDFGWYTEEMQVLYGVTNPPTDILVDWTDQLRHEIPFVDLEYNKKYYFQVNERNVSGVTEGEIINFTTVREGVENFLVDKTEVYYGINDTVTFTWDAQEGALGYKLYYGEYNDQYDYWYWYGQVGEIVTETSCAVPVDFYMWPDMEGIDFAVTAMYKYGDSDFSNRQRVYVSSVANYIAGYVYEIDNITPIAGATVAITCIDEFEQEHTYELTTAEDGRFEYYTNVDEEAILYAGAYTISYAKEGYQTYTEETEIAAFDGYYNAIALTENYYPVTNVVAIIVEGNDKMIATEAVNVTWEMEGMDRSLQSFNVYRTDAYNNGPYTTLNTEIIAEGVTEMTYTDATWAEITVGSYKYGVSAVYAGNAPQQNRGNREVVEVINEGFEYGLPEGWTIEGNTQLIWTTNSGDYDSSSSSAYSGEYNLWAHNDNEYLDAWSYFVSPMMDLSEAESATISLAYMNRCWAGWDSDYEQFALYYRVDGGGWNELFYTGTNHESWQTLNDIELPELAANYQIAIGAYHHYGYGLCVDDIVLTAVMQEAEPVQAGNESEIVWSEPLDVNMVLEDGLDITVNLNNGESPEGVVVTLTNIDTEEVLSVELDETGYYAWDTVRKGNYRVVINLNDNYSTVDDEVSIWEPTNLVYTLNYLVPLTNTAVMNPVEGGYGGVVFNNYYYPSLDYLYGQQGRLWAQANYGYEFMFWTNIDADTLVSYNNDFFYTVTSAGNYMAHFRKAENNHYIVDNPMQYSNNMSFIGAIAIEGELQNDLDLEVGAFAGDECRGGARLQYYPQVNKFLVFLTVYGNEDGEEITFRLYNHTIGEEYDLRCATKESFEAEAVFGTATEPYVFNFRDTVLQIVEFAEGWNWMSTYLEQSVFDGLAAIEEGLDTVGVRIVSQSNGFVEYDAEYDEWSGTLTALNNEEMFKVNTTADVTFVMDSYEANPAYHEITLYNGWTYLGFISMEPMPIETALAGLEPTDGDMIKAQEGFATYDAEYDEWSGSLNTLNPGLGFMYKSNNENEVTFTYPTVNRGETNANVTSEHWMANVHAYPNNMTVVAVVELNDTELIGGEYELAAFVDGEVRGSVKLINAGVQGRYYAFLTVAGNEAANISFGLYDAETGVEMLDSNTRLSYSNNAMVGSMSEPFVVSFRGTTGIGELNGGVAMYPNPAEKNGYVNLVMAESHARVEIINSMGQVVSEQTTTQMPASIQTPEEAGVYTVRIITEGKNIKCQKLIVK